MAGRLVVLVTTEDEMANEELISQLRHLSGLDLQITFCSPTVAEWYRCPFVRDSSGATFFGPEGIQFFVDRERSHLHQSG